MGSFAIRSYLGLLINAAGWALAFRSGVGLLLAALFIPPLIAHPVGRRAAALAIWR